RVSVCPFACVCKYAAKKMQSFLKFQIFVHVIRILLRSKRGTVGKMATALGSHGGSALFQRSYRSSLDRASTQQESCDDSHVVLEESVHRIFGPSVSVVRGHEPAR